jgi:ATP-dependent exoDNAse (exonuclease V) beta subunit
LILFGSARQSSLEKFLEDEEDSRSTDLFHVESKSSWLQWLLMASPIYSDHEFQSPEIGSRTFGWGILSPQKQTASTSDSSTEETTSSSAGDSSDIQSQDQDESAGSDWAARMEWSYPYQEGSRLPGKTSVSRIKSALIQQTEDNEEAPNPWETEEPGEDLEPHSALSPTAPAPAPTPAPLPFHSMPPQRSAAENQQLELPMEELASTDEDHKQEQESAKEPLESSPQKISGADRGLALHRLMERYPFDQDLNPKEQLAFAGKLNNQGILSNEQLQALDWRGIHWFLKSDLGLQIISNAKAEANRIRREVPFTWWSDLATLSQMGWKKEAILGAATLEASSSISGANKAPSPPILLNEEGHTANPDHVVIQGVMDLVVLLDNECWLIDYKTDRFPISQLQEKQEEHAPQLKVYQRALEDLTGKKVTRALLVFIHAREVVSVI